MRTSTTSKKQIVVLGGGFAGVRASLDLAHLLKDDPDHEVVLIDRRDSQVYHPALYEAATTEHGLIDARKVRQAVTLPYSMIFKTVPIRLVRAYAEDINFSEGVVATDSGAVPYTYLIVALGSQTNYYGIPELDRHAFPLKTFEDAIMIRNRLAEIVNKRDMGIVVIGGAGVSGVEFAAELRGLIRHLCSKLDKDPAAFRIVMVEGATDFLPNLTVRASEAVSTRLKEKFSIETRFSTLITEAGKDYVVLNNKDRLPCDLLVWTGGVKAARLPAFGSLERDKKERVVVTEALNLKKFPNVFFAGDLSSPRDFENRKTPPQIRSEAINQGRHSARNIWRMIKREPPLPYVSSGAGYGFQVGPGFAVYHSRDLIMSGRLAWLIKRWKDWLYFRSVLQFPTAAKIWLLGSEIFKKND